MNALLQLSERKEREKEEQGGVKEEEAHHGDGRVTTLGGSDGERARKRASAARHRRWKRDSQGCETE
jgi:hypothetical protein